MNHQSSTITKRLLLLLVLVISAAFLAKGLLTLGFAQSTQERELEDTTPKHIPIKIKVKTEKEKVFKNLQNDDWLRDLEIEVTNTGDKPIYYLLIVVEMDDIKAGDGTPVAYPLHYGQLSNFKDPPKPEHVPIKQGETYVLKFPPAWVRGWYKFSREEKKPQPKKVRIIFQKITFGDGTGYHDSSGSPFPQSAEKGIYKPVQSRVEQRSLRCATS